MMRRCPVLFDRHRHAGREVHDLPLDLHARNGAFTRPHLNMAEHARQVQCDPKVSGALLRELRSRRRKTTEEQGNDPLTRRECDVLRLLGRGASNKEIARQLGVSDATIKNHVHEVLAKLRVHRRAQAAARLREQPWIATVG